MQYRDKMAMRVLAMGPPANTMLIEIPERMPEIVCIDNRPARRAKRTNKKMKARGF